MTCTENVKKNMKAYFVRLSDVNKAARGVIFSRIDVNYTANPDV